VRVIRFLSQDTIEEGIYSIAQDKLQLERDLSNADDSKPNTATSKKDLKKLLKIALDVNMETDEQIGDVEKIYTEL
jgi:SNF2 family DNA or RNA helicase